MDGDSGWALVLETTTPLSQQGASRPSVKVDLPMGSRVVAGRGLDAPIRLPLEDNLASRYHASFQASAAGVLVIDLDSRNGVFVNEQRLNRASIAHAGDRVRLGATLVRIEQQETSGRHNVYTEETTGAHTVFAGVGTTGGAPAWASSTSKSLPYVCEVCSAKGPVPALDHEAWWQEVAWICASCADRRRVHPSQWEVSMPERVGDFQLLRFIARGGMAAVYEARHVHAGMRAAVKVMLPDRKLNPAGEKRFLKEQRFMTDLAHERIVRCFSIGREDAAHGQGQLWVASEFLSRGDAEALALKTDVRTAVAIVKDLYEGLAFAHERGLVHRDIKPSNLLLAPPDHEGRPHAKLADFGLAKSFKDVGGTIVTKDGEIGGSAAFVAPEQLLGFRDVGPSADVYAGAVTLYYLLTADVPVVLSCPLDRATDPQLCLAALADERVPIAVKRPDLHPWLVQWIDLLVGRDHKRRAHVTAASVAAMLRAYPG